MNSVRVPKRTDPAADSPPRVTPLLPGHAAALMKLRHQAVLENPAAFGTSPERETAKTPGHYRIKLLKLAASNRDILLGLWLSERLTGMCGLGHREDDRGPVALIYSMYVLPEARGRGLARMLLNHCDALAREKWGVTRCQLCVETHNRAAFCLYRKAGYTLRRTERAAFRLNGQDFDVHHLEKILRAESRSPESDR